MQPFLHHFREVFFAFSRLAALKPSPPFSGAGTLAVKPGVENPTINNNDKIQIDIFLCINKLLLVFILFFLGNSQLSNIGMITKNLYLYHLLSSKVFWVYFDNNILILLHDDRDFDPMVSHFSLKTPTPR
jgi:hypothetical protein